MWDNKCYERILKDKDIKAGLEYLEPRQTTYKATVVIRMIINELKDKGIIPKDWWETYINKEVLKDEKN